MNKPNKSNKPARLQPRKPGRPTRDPAERASVKITVWFTPEQYAEFMGYKPEGYPVATWARKLLLEHAEKVKALDALSGRRKKRS